MSGGVASHGCSVRQTRWLCDVIMRRPPGTTVGISGLYLRAHNSLKMKQQVERKHLAGESQRDFIQLLSLAHPSCLSTQRSDANILALIIN